MPDSVLSVPGLVVEPFSPGCWRVGWQARGGTLGRYTFAYTAISDEPRQFRAAIEDAARRLVSSLH